MTNLAINELKFFFLLSIYLLLLCSGLMNTLTLHWNIPVLPMGGALESSREIGYCEIFS